MMVWQKFLSQHDQTFLSLAGIVPGQQRCWTRPRGGLQMFVLMANYQDRWQIAKDARQVG
jgi:hypothetical protein